MAQHRSTLSAPADTLTVEIKLAPETLAALTGMLRLFEAAAHPLAEMPSPMPSDGLPLLNGIGERVRFLRLVKGLSQEELAARVGVSRATINYTENENSHPNGATSSALANALGCNVFWLVTGLGAPPLSPRQDASQPMTVAPAPTIIPPTERCEIGKRVRHVRVFRGLNLLQLASSAGYSDSVIGKIESNVSKPKPPIVKALAAALGCDESWLLTGLGDPGLDGQRVASA